MLLTPRIIRTHEYTARDLSPIYVGTNQNFGLTGPPPLIAAPPADATPEPAAAPPGATPPAPPTPPGPQAGTPSPMFPQGGAAGQVTTLTPQAPPPAEPPATGFPPPPTAAPPAAALPMPQVSVVAPAGDVRVAGGPYMVPIYINGASGVSTVTITLQYNPAALRIRTIQEGNFLKQGGANVVFAPNTDAALGRVDLTFVRTADAIGASGAGLLAGILFDAVGSGTSPLALSGVAAGPGGANIPVQFSPATVVVR
jgi:hypothetical protein